LSVSGKREARYFPTKAAGEEFIAEFKQDRNEHGKQAVTSEERHWITFLRRELGNMDLVPEVVRHWKRTASESITKTSVRSAVDAFSKARLPGVSKRTESDIKWRLNALAEHFAGRCIHELASGDLENFLAKYEEGWSRRSFFKRIKPLFAYARRHRMIAVDPVEMLVPPEVPSAKKAVYTPKQFQDLLLEAQTVKTPHLLAFCALSGFGFLRTSELVRLYHGEQILEWEDINWEQERIHVREEVGKATRRRSGNERFVPMRKELVKWLSESRRLYERTERKVQRPIVPLFHGEFAKQWRALHTAAEVPIIHNGLRRSAISHALAADPELGVVQAARWAGSSESTVKRHYLENLTPEQGKAWFEVVMV
jgi:integrase